MAIVLGRRSVIQLAVLSCPADALLFVLCSDLDTFPPVQAVITNVENDLQRSVL